MAAKAQVAARATSEVRSHIEQAVELLGDPDSRASNALGVFLRPGDRMVTLQAAKDAIDTAIAVMAKTQWPTEADYNAPDHDNDF
jgi:hypothetical protein